MYVDKQFLLVQQWYIISVQENRQFLWEKATTYLEFIEQIKNKNGFLVDFFSFREKLQLWESIMYIFLSLSLVSRF